MKECLLSGLGLTICPRISVDEEIALPGFITKPFIGEVNIGGITTTINNDYYDTVNNDISGKSIILGKGNTVDPNISAIVIGDNGVITDSGVWVNGQKLAEPSETDKKNIITLTRDYNAEVDLYDMFILNSPNITIALPSASDYEDYVITLKNTSSGITKATGSIDNMSGITLTTWESVTLVSNGSIWLII